VGPQVTRALCHKGGDQYDEVKKDAGEKKTKPSGQRKKTRTYARNREEKGRAGKHKKRHIVAAAL